MLKKTVRNTALAAAFELLVAGALTVGAAAAHAAPPDASTAASDKDKALAEIRAQIRDMKQSYEARLQALEQRLQDAQSQAQAQSQASQQTAAKLAAVEAANASQATAPAVAAAPVTAAAAAPAAAAPAAASNPNSFNPAIALILGGTYARLSQDPQQYRLQGFAPSGGEVGPGKRSFSLGESELTLSANIDPQFAGVLTFSLDGESSASVEEAFFQTQGLSSGLNLKAGRFLSALGYLNSQHAHAWDFVDAPLAYQAFLGGQYKPDGVQAKWLLPTERFAEIGLELGNGTPFPGNERNKNGIGSATVFGHVGDDIGDSASWRAGLSYLHTGSAARTFDDVGRNGAAVVDSMNLKSALWVADAIYKWSPNGNPTYSNFKLQGEYFRRTENGEFTFDAQGPANASAAYRSTQSGWYLQSVYQFMPMWRAGLRYDRLNSGNARVNLADTGALLNAYNPARTSVMLDYTPSEFSRFRLQLARDQSRPGASDNQLFLQYVMSLGAHGAHTF